MAFSRVLSQRPGIRVEFHAQPDGTFIINTVQDVEPILEANKIAANEVGKNTRGKYMAKVASIPTVVQYQWIKEYGTNPVYDEDDTLLKRLLNSSDWRYLKSSELIL